MTFEELDILLIEMEELDERDCCIEEGGRTE